MPRVPCDAIARTAPIAATIRQSSTPRHVPGLRWTRVFSTAWSRRSLSTDASLPGFGRKHANSPITDLARAPQQLSAVHGPVRLCHLPAAQRHALFYATATGYMCGVRKTPQAGRLSFLSFGMNMAALRIVSAMLPLGAMAVLVAGCGNSGSSTTNSATNATNASASRASASSYARGSAFVHAVNLVQADVPGMRLVKPEGENKAPTRTGIEFAQCAGGVNPYRRIVDIHSPTFAGSRLRERVRSAVEVMPTVALADQNNRAARSARGRACLVRFLGRALPEQGAGPVHHGPISVSSLPSLLPSAAGSFGLRLVTTVTVRPLGGRPGQISLYLDEFGFISGPAEVNLTATGLSRPVPAEAERRLLGLLYSRAQAHPL